MAAYKLRRPPLLVYDNGVNGPGIYSHHCYDQSSLKMDCGLSTAYLSTANGNSPKKAGDMAPTKGAGHKDLHVNFDGKEVVQAKKTKFLTAKYGTHQMSLIKKRLGVEMWMYDELLFLYNSTDDCEVELDLDELLDIEDDGGRKHWLQEKLVNAKQPQDAVRKFIDALMQRATTL